MCLRTDIAKAGSLDIILLENPMKNSLAAFSNIVPIIIDKKLIGGGR